MTLGPTANDIYLALVDTAFAPGGPLARACVGAGRTFHYNRTQLDYARHVARTFAAGRGAHGGPMSLLEGETGMGKTLGYLVPMAIFCALGGKRGVVAASAEAVADPHYRDEMALAFQVAHELTGRRLACARRFAPSDFLSRRRIEAMAARLAPHRDDLQVAVAALLQACGDGALLPQVLRDHGPLPGRIAAADICDDGDGAAYKAHLAAAVYADILLVPHGLLLEGMAGKGDLAAEVFDCAVIDEGDVLPAAVAGLEAQPDWSLPRLGSLCFTGALLDPDGLGNDPGFRAWREGVGLTGRGNVRVDLGGRFLPPRFGSLVFNLSHPGAPRPTVEGDRFSKDDNRNPHWYDYVEAVLADIAMLRQRTLVLTCHHKDTAELARRLRARKAAVIAYRPGDSLSHVLAAFSADPAAILIGANLWERVNLPGLVRHLVIPRLPIGGRPMAPAPEGVKAQEAQRQVLSERMREARRKLRLGIGRAIRAATDDGHVWITDPRFPLPGSLTDNPRLRLPPGDPYHRTFSACIPERFRAGLFATYPQATLIDPGVRAAEPDVLRPAKRQARH